MNISATLENGFMFLGQSRLMNSALSEHFCSGKWAAVLIIRDEKSKPTMQQMIGL